jgi:hypothetical protein
MMPQNNKKRGKIMDSVIKYVTGFFGGLLSIMMAVIPVSILWYVLTGGAIFNMDVVANLTALINSIGQGGFVGLVVLVILVSFFTKK